CGGEKEANESGKEKILRDKDCRHKQLVGETEWRIYRRLPTPTCQDRGATTLPRLNNNNNNDFSDTMSTSSSRREDDDHDGDDNDDEHEEDHKDEIHRTGDHGHGTRYNLNEWAHDFVDEHRLQHSCAANTHQCPPASSAFASSSSSSYSSSSSSSSSSSICVSHFSHSHSSQSQSHSYANSCSYLCGHNDSLKNTAHSNATTVSIPHMERLSDDHFRLDRDHGNGKDKDKNKDLGNDYRHKANYPLHYYSSNEQQQRYQSHMQLKNSNMNEYRQQEVCKFCKHTQAQYSSVEH
ncbi:hypothetical protein RFI_01088, partial [Reticulomyxa filosa]